MQIVADPVWVSGFLMAMVRAAAWIFVCPPFGTRVIPPMMKVGLAAVLAIALGPTVRELAVPLDAGSLVAGAALQVFAGVALGFIGVLLFAAFQAAGNFIDLLGGLGAAQLFDPLTQQVSSIYGRLYQMLATVLLFAVDGHLLLVRGFLGSVEAAPTGLPGTGDMAGGFTESLGMFFVSALEIAAPLLAALFLADVALGLLARAAPDLNVFLVGLPGKVLLTIGLTSLTLPFLPGAVEAVVETIVRFGTNLFGG